MLDIGNQARSRRRWRLLRTLWFLPSRGCIWPAAKDQDNPAYYRGLPSKWMSLAAYPAPVLQDQAALTQRGLRVRSNEPGRASQRKLSRRLPGRAASACRPRTAATAATTSAPSPNVEVDQKELRIMGSKSALLVRLSPLRAQKRRALACRTEMARHDR